MTSSLKLFLILYYIKLLLYKTKRFQVAVCLFSNRSQRTSKCGKNINDTLGCALCASKVVPEANVLSAFLQQLVHHSVPG